MPKDEIIKASGLFGDVTTVTKKWEKQDAEAKKQTENNVKAQSPAETNVTANDKVDNKVLGANGGNNSQE